MGYDSSSFDAPIVLFITYCDCDVVRSLNEDFILKSIGCFQTKRNDLRGYKKYVVAIESNLVFYRN